MFYSVRNGREVGVFTTWEETKRSIENFPGAKFRKFKTKEEAYDFLDPTKKPTSAISDPNADYPKDAIKVFTDGSCVPIPNEKKETSKCTHLAGYSVFFGDNSELNYLGYITSGQTNQKVELLAIRRALEILKDYKKPVAIFTDSMYSINCVTRWYKNWEKNGFMTSTGKPVKHLEIIKAIRKIYKKGNFTFVHMNSHTPKPECSKDSEEYIIWYGNQQADHFANLAAMKSLDDLDS